MDDKMSYISNEDEQDQYFSRLKLLVEKFKNENSINVIIFLFNKQDNKTCGVK